VRRPSPAPREGEGVGPYNDLPSSSPEAVEILRGELRASWLELAKALEREQARRAERERRESRGGSTWWEWLGDGLKDPRTFLRSSDAPTYEKARREMIALVDQADQTARARHAGSSLHAGKLLPRVAPQATEPRAPPPAGAIAPAAVPLPRAGPAFRGPRCAAPPALGGSPPA
jgi:hypothetical protein